MEIKKEDDRNNRQYVMVMDPNSNNTNSNATTSDGQGIGVQQVNLKVEKCNLPLSLREF